MLNATPSLTWNKDYVGGRLLDSLEIEQRVITFTNDARQEAGLRALIADPAISAIAREHSINMRRRGIFDHDIDGKGPTDRALDAGYDCRGLDGSYGFSENIAEEPRVWEWSGYGSRSSWTADIYYKDEEETAQALVDGWMNSSGHRRNILDRQARRIGVGVAVEQTRRYSQVGERFYATQNFSACQ